ncbi:MAG: hypothetical protein O2931_10935 [Planctomycetota bacterium]|nr:hypothetical protein [Planctomycetota bacterium]MDA1179298.1 hypothetical protein [Planctomycetota bacterium]
MSWEHVLWALALFAGMFFVSLGLVTLVLVKLPSKYFLGVSHRRLWIDQHPIVRFGLHLVKNLVGLGLIVAGVLLSLPGIPGQGILTILIGIALLDFPGKWRWERKMVSHPVILRSINRIRHAFGARPLQLTEDDDPC